MPEHFKKMITTATSTAKILSATASAALKNRQQAEQFKQAFTEPMVNALKGTGEFLYNATLKTIPPEYLWGFLAFVIVWVLIWFWYNFIR